MINWYGPCECSPGTFCTVSEEPWHDGVIGYANSSHGARCWLVDPSDQENLTLVARGAPGEIVLEGPACAVGYLGAEAPSDRFLNNPPFLTRGHGTQFAGRNGRVYRTGDLAFFNSEGMLVFKGRKDSVLKIRGQFVSPDEVEHHIRRLLLSLESVEVAVDAVTRPESEVVHLTAYIAGSLDPNDASLHAIFAALRQELGAVLPQFAVPTLYIPLVELPLTATGKVNRTRLRELGKAYDPPQEALTPEESPTNAAERTLQSLWSKTLRLESSRISRNSNFLSIADSVSAMRMVSMAQREGFSLTVADIFRKPLLKDMAQCLRTIRIPDNSAVTPFALLDPNLSVQEACREAASIAGVSPCDIEDMYPCTPLQEGLLALTLKTPGTYMGFNVLEIAPVVDLTRFKTAWEQVVETIPILRTRIVDIPGNGLLQVVVREKPRWSTPKDSEDFIKECKENPVGLGTPLSRFGIHTAGNCNASFCLMLHHAVYDGATLLIIREALEQRYNGEDPACPRPFASFISHMTARDKDEEVQFWQDQFQDLEAPTWPALPHEEYHPKPDSTYTHIVNDLKWRTDGYTNSTLIRAAFSLVAMKYTDASDFVFGTIVSGRKAALPGIEQIAGPTISTVPVRVKVEAEQTLGSFLSALQQHEVDSIRFEQTGISQICKVSDEAWQACRFQSAMVIQPEELHMSASSCFISEPDEESLNPDTFASFNVYSLMLVCTLQKAESGDVGLRLEFSFDDKVIDFTTTTKVAGQFEEALRQLNQGDLDSRTSQLSVVPIDELHQIWQSNHSTPPASQQTVHAMIAEVALNRPDDLAISAWDGDYTYSELDQLSDSIAHHLIQRGVEGIVPICFEKSKFNTAACIGVIKAKAAVLFLDSTQPEARLKTILSQIEAKVILSSPTNAAMCSRLVSEVVVLSDLHIPCSVPAADSPLPFVEPSDLLFVIPTSGSTGK